MQVAITGSSGFLGKSLSRYLSLNGFDCLNITRKEISGTINVKSYEEIPNSEIIVHLAQNNDRNFVNSQSFDYVEKSLRETKCIANKKCKKLIYISSGSVYGDQKNSLRKTSEILNPYDNYSKIKLNSEKIILNNGGMVLRLSNVYGLNMSRKNVLSKIINQVINKKIIKLFNGNAIRDFIWIDDVITAIKETIISDLKQTILNIGSGKGTSIIDLTNHVQSIYGTNLPVYYETNESKISSIILDISNSIKNLNWLPTTEIKEGIYKMMNSRKLSYE